MVCASTELQQNTPARAVNELHRAGVPLFYKENAQSGDFRQYRTILSAAAAGAVLKPSGGNCAVLPYKIFPLLPPHRIDKTACVAYCKR